MQAGSGIIALLVIAAAAAGSGSAPAAARARAGAWFQYGWWAPIDRDELDEEREVLGTVDGRAVVRTGDGELLVLSGGGEGGSKAPARMAIGLAPATLVAGRLVVLEGQALVAHQVGADGLTRLWEVPVTPPPLVPYGTGLVSAAAKQTLLFTGAGCDDRCPNQTNDGKDPALIAVDAATGAVRWRRRSSGAGEIDALAAAADDRFVVASHREALAFAAATGQLLWRTGRRPGDRGGGGGGDGASEGAGDGDSADDGSMLAIDGQDVFFARTARHLARLALASGQRRWEIPLGGMAVKQLIASQGTVFVALREAVRFANPRSNAVQAIDAASGRRLWELPCGVTHLVAGPAGTLVVMETATVDRHWQSRLLLVDRASGAVRDSFRVGQGTSVVLQPPAAPAPAGTRPGTGMVVVGTSGGVLALTVGNEPPPPSPPPKTTPPAQRSRVVAGRVTTSGGVGLGDFPVHYQDGAPGWPVRTARTNARGEFTIQVGAADVTPIWLDDGALERYRRATEPNPRLWDCHVEPDIHFVLGAAPQAERLATSVTCFHHRD